MAAKFLFALLVAVCVVQALHAFDISSMMETMKQEMQEKMEDMKQLAHNIQEKAGSAIESARERASSAMHEALNRVQEAVHSAKDKGADVSNCLAKAKDEMAALNQEANTKMEPCSEKMKTEVEDLKTRMSVTMQEAQDLGHKVMDDVKNCMQTSSGISKFSCMSKLWGFTDGGDILKQVLSELKDGALLMKDLPMEYGKCTKPYLEEMKNGAKDIAQEAASCIKNTAPSA